MADKKSLQLYRTKRGFKPPAAPPDPDPKKDGPDLSDVIARLERIEKHAQTQEERYQASQRLEQIKLRAGKYRDLKSRSAPNKSKRSTKPKPIKKRKFGFRGRGK